MIQSLAAQAWSRSPADSIARASRHCRRHGSFHVAACQRFSASRIHARDPARKRWPRTIEAELLPERLLGLLQRNSFFHTCREAS